jgi:Asp-tRNA(Asn)/Glu-tRNA(Gln) amidotransferase A subunit family amidase
MESSKKDKDKMKTATLEGFRPYVVYRKQAGDPVRAALENAAKQLELAGKFAVEICWKNPSESQTAYRRVSNTQTPPM